MTVDRTSDPLAQRLRDYHGSPQGVRRLLLEAAEYIDTSNEEARCAEAEIERLRAAIIAEIPALLTELRRLNAGFEARVKSRPNYL